jgi:hypothetical protein
MYERERKKDPNLGTFGELATWQNIQIAYVLEIELRSHTV